MTFAKKFAGIRALGSCRRCTSCNDAYVTVEETLDFPMNVFKHHVVAYTMDKKHVELKSLYLYRGYLREAKAIVKNGYLEITFQSARIAELWDSAEEKLDDVPWLFRDFVKMWKPVNTDYSYMRVYQKY